MNQRACQNIKGHKRAYQKLNSKNLPNVFYALEDYTSNSFYDVIYFSDVYALNIIVYIVRNMY